MDSKKSGVFFALSAYSIWGFLTVYIKLLQNVPVQEMLVHRIVWSFVFTGLLLVLFKNLKSIRTIFSEPKNLLALLLSSLLIAVNWLLFIWAVQNDRMLDASLGYYINPLINVLLGLLILGERLRRMQQFAVALAFIGVSIQVFAFGEFPWIALVMACSFATYGLIRKQVRIEAQTGLFIETLVLLVPTLCYVFVSGQAQTLNLLENTSSLNLLLVLAGPFTSIPLILFAAAAKRLNYSTLGFLQYIAPSVIFLLAVFAYGEVFTVQKSITFVFIWLALVIFSLDGLQYRRLVVQ